MREPAVSLSRSSTCTCAITATTTSTRTWIPHPTPQCSTGSSTGLRSNSSSSSHGRSIRIIQTQTPSALPFLWSGRCTSSRSNSRFASSHSSSSRASSSSSSSSSSRASSSSSLSEQVTRTVLGASSAMMHAGVSPAGICAFAAASASASSSSSAAVDLPSSIRVTFSPVSGEQAEQLSDCLLGFGAQSVVVQEARSPGGEEQQRYGAEAELWDSCQVLAHFALEHDVECTMFTVRDILALPGLSYTSQCVVDQEWVEQIKASYVPVQVCERLFIVPEWAEPPDPAAVNIRLTPGVAFGTGEHPTTKLCLRLLATLPLGGWRLCDYGTGSGVLAIAALLLGADSGVGTDTDPLAVRAAGANAALNGVEQRLQLVQCGANIDDPDPLLELPGSVDRTFDLVVANILRGPLLELHPRLSSYCKPGGRLALSGILTEQAPDVVAAYSPHFEEFEVSSEGSWALITAKRRA